MDLRHLILLAITIAQGCCLHLESTSDFYLDNLPESNLNYYYGEMTPIQYYMNQQQLQSAHPDFKTCPQSAPYANIHSNRQRCMGCAPISDQTNVSEDKVLYNLETGRCELCAVDKTAICNKLLGKASVLDEGNSVAPTPVAAAPINSVAPIASSNTRVTSTVDRSGDSASSQSSASQETTINTMASQPSISTSTVSVAPTPVAE